MASVGRSTSRHGEQGAFDLPLVLPISGCLALPGTFEMKHPAVVRTAGKTAPCASTAPLSPGNSLQGRR